MAVTASGLFYPTFRDLMDTSGLALDLDLETHKGALFTDSLAPSFSADTAYGVVAVQRERDLRWFLDLWWYRAHRHHRHGVPHRVVMFDATDVSVASTTITNAMCYLLYADALSSPTWTQRSAWSTSSPRTPPHPAPSASSGQQPEFFAIDLTP